MGIICQDLTEQRRDVSFESFLTLEFAYFITLLSSMNFEDVEERDGAVLAISLPRVASYPCFS